MKFREFINLMYGKMTQEYCCYMQKPCCKNPDDYFKQNKWYLKRKFKEQK